MSLVREEGIAAIERPALLSQEAAPEAAARAAGESSNEQP